MRFNVERREARGMQEAAMAETEKDKKVWINMEILTKEQCKVNAPAAGESEGRAYPWQA